MTTTTKLTWEQRKLLSVCKSLGFYRCGQANERRAARSLDRHGLIHFVNGIAALTEAGVDIAEPARTFVHVCDDLRFGEGCGACCEEEIARHAT